MGVILEARGLSRKYPRKRGGANFFYAVEEVDLTIEAGTVTEIIGRSGSGKTTLLHLLAGLLTPSEGQVLYQGRDLYDQPDAALSALRAREFGVIPQIHSGLEHLTVQENVALAWGLLTRDRPPMEEIHARADQLLHSLGIAHLAQVRPDELSGGELRRLAIARAMLLRPKLIFADEPTGDLDDENTGLVLDQLKAAAGEGTAVVMVTHEAEAAAYADRVYRMDGGRLQAE